MLARAFGSKRPAALRGLEMVALRERQEAEAKAAVEIRILN